MKPKISIIVPIYNVEKYLRECLDSILAQTFTDWECILIDDGSPDNCGKICDEYAEKDARFKVIHQENMGVNAARRNGVRQSCGEYVTFSDSDDMLYPNALQSLYECMDDDVDITVGKIHRDNEYHKYNRLLTFTEYRKIIILCGLNGLCAKLYRSNLFDDEIFNIPRSLIVNEDWLAGVRLAFQNNKPVKLSEQIVYFYRQHSESIMHTFKKTPDYEYISYNLVRNAIPDKEKPLHMQQLILAELGLFRHLFCYCNVDPYNWIGSNLQKQMLEDVKTYNFHLSMLDRLICFTNISESKRHFLIFIWKVIKKAKKVLGFAN